MPAAPAHRLLALALALTLAGALFAVRPAAAQVAPPHPGVELPPGYFDRLALDRDAFQFKHAWIAQTRRVQHNRRLRELGRLDGIMDGSSASAFRVEGTRRVPVLAGKFANTGSDPYSVIQLQQQLFDGPNPTGTVTQFYDEISSGYINLTGTVYGAQGGGLFPVSQNDTYYEGPSGCNGLCSSANTGEYLKELLDGADSWVDFSQFDNDGPDGIPNSGDDDGYVDFVAFVQPEAGGECGGNNIWSHRWVYEGWWGAPYSTNDAAANGGTIKVSDYTIQPLVSCNGTSLIEIGVFAHEFGHAFGLPDLYDTDYSSAGVGNWCLMASGSYGGDGSHPATPAHMSAWCKEQLGWVDPTLVCGDLTGASLPAVETSGEVLKVFPHGVPDDEYFLVENRVKTGFDTYLRTSGLAIWHIDNGVSGNTNEAHKLVDLEEADGLDQLDSNTNRGDAGDLYPGAYAVQLFDDTTHPDAHDYAGAATGFSASNFGAAANPRTLDVTLTGCRLGVVDVAVDDAANGNNSGSLDGNERAGLTVGLRNDLLPDVTGVEGTLVSLTPGVVVRQASVSYGTVTGSVVNYGAGAFEIEATGPLADGAAVDLRLDLTGDAGYSSSSDITLHAGNYVLLVEDDGSEAHRSLFTAAVTAAGYAYVAHDVAVDGLPGLGRLQSARAVIWYTGQEYDDTFTPEEQAVLESYLDGGGALFVTGQDIGYDLVSQGSAADQAFYQDYLHANFISDSSGSTPDNTLTGVTGDPIGNGISLDLAGGDGANNSTYPSVISSRAGASDVFRYSSTKTGAVRFSTGHKLVYFAYNFEAINAASVRATTMQRVLDWLFPADVTPPTAAVVSPDGGEVLDACGSSAVTWTASDDVGVTSVDLYWSDDPAELVWQPIATGLPNTGSAVWTRSGVFADSARVKVVAHDAAGLQGVDFSNAAFTLAALAPPSASVAAPNGGEAFPAGSVVPVSWSMSDTCAGIDSTRVFASLDGGGSWSWVGTVPAPDTVFAWSTPAMVTDSVLVRVEVHAASGLTGVDESDALFSLADATPPTVSLIAPDGGESFGTGNAVPVDWSASDDAGVDHLDLYYSTDDGGSWTAMATGEANSPPFGWTAPDLPSTLYRVRVVAFDALGNSAADTSSASFTVADDDAPVVTLTAPDGGEALTGGLNADITGSATDNVGVDSVCVAYTRDDGASWVAIACGTVSFPYAWAVPDSASDSCRVRITAWDAAGNSAAAMSDSTFSILGNTTAVGPGFGGVTRPVLLQSRPNPMRASSAVLAFYLPVRMPVSLRIYDLSGRLVKTVAEGEFAGGYHETTWNGTSDAGVRVGHGIYFTVLRTPERREVRKLVKLQ